MRKRTLSDVKMDEIRQGRRKYLDKKRRERIEADKIIINEIIIKNSNSKPFNLINRPVVSNHGDRILRSRNHRNLRKIACPKNLCLDSNIDETIKFLNRLPGVDNPIKKTGRGRSKSYNPPVKESYFDFASVERICPASALIISSCYFMYKKRGSSIYVYDWKDWNEGVRETLMKMGFFGLLDFEPIPADEDSQEIPIKGFRTGNTVTGQETGEYFQRLVQQIDEKVSKGKESESFKQTAFAILEAVENSVRHAYPIDFPDDVRNRWWFGGIFSSDKKEITLVCYDKGISIPKHIKETALEDRGHRIRSTVNEAINRFILKTGKNEEDDNLDHKRLQIAMKYARTSTKRGGSGKGLKFITETIKDFRDGEVTIMSRRAYASITKDKPSVFKLLDTFIIGTLIVWKLRL